MNKLEVGHIYKIARKVRNKYYTSGSQSFIVKDIDGDNVSAVYLSSTLNKKINIKDKVVLPVSTKSPTVFYGGQSAIMKDGIIELSCKRETFKIIDIDLDTIIETAVIYQKYADRSVYGVLRYNKDSQHMCRLFKTLKERKITMKYNMKDTLEKIIEDKGVNAVYRFVKYIQDTFDSVASMDAKYIIIDKNDKLHVGVELEDIPDIKYIVGLVEYSTYTSGTFILFENTATIKEITERNKSMSILDQIRILAHIQDKFDSTKNNCILDARYGNTLDAVKDCTKLEGVYTVGKYGNVKYRYKPEDIKDLNAEVIALSLHYGVMILKDKVLLKDVLDRKVSAILNKLGDDK